MDGNPVTAPLIEVAKEAIKERSKDIYDDGLKPATKESGEALQAIVGLFNNVVLYPVKKANITFRYKLEKFEQDLKTKINNIPSDKLIEAPLTVAGPTLEALKYTYDIKELREMYINLLATSMNKDTIISSHPAYVDIIRQMSQLDAIIFKKAFKIGQIACAKVTIGYDTKVFIHAMPEIYIPDLIDEEDPFVISSIVQNLCRLGLLTHSDKTIHDYNYESFRNHNFVQSQFERYKASHPEVDLNIKITGEVIYLNDFSKNFGLACLND